MSKRRKRIDNHDQFAFDFERKIETYRAAREEILDACHIPQTTKNIAIGADACIEIAVACKRSIRHTNLSREQVVDEINECFGDKKALHPHAQQLPFQARKYPIPAYYLYAIQHVTGLLEPAQALVEPEDGRVITRAAVSQMAPGKLDETILEMQR